MAWLYLAIAIIVEVIATAALKASDGFNNSTASTVCTRQDHYKLEFKAHL